MQKKREMMSHKNNQQKFNALMLDTSTRCNLRCIMCPSILEDVSYDMSLDLYRKIASEIFPYVKSVVYACDYEPLMSPIFDELLLDMPNHPYIGKSMFTNAVLLNDNKIKKIIASGLDKVIISLHSTEKDIYESISIGSDLEVVLANIKLFINIKKKLKVNKPSLEFVVTVMKRNIKSMPGIVKLAASFNIRKVTFRRMIAINKELESETIDNCNELLLENFNRSKELAEKYKIELEYPSEFSMLVDRTMLMQQPISSVAPKFCDAHRGSIWVDPRGLLKPCNCWSGASIGDMKESHFIEILQADKYKTIRKQINSDKFPENCSKCFLNRC